MNSYAKMLKKVSAKGGVDYTFKQSQTTIKKLIKPRLPKNWCCGNQKKTQKQQKWKPETSKTETIKNKTYEKNKKHQKNTLT